MITNRVSKKIEPKKTNAKEMGSASALTLGFGLNFFEYYQGRMRPMHIYVPTPPKPDDKK